MNFNLVTSAQFIHFGDVFVFACPACYIIYQLACDKYCAHVNRTVIESMATRPTKKNVPEFVN